MDEWATFAQNKKLEAKSDLREKEKEERGPGQGLPRAGVLGRVK